MNYDFDNIPNRYNTGSLKYDGKKIFNMEDDVLPMWIADMDFPTCNCVKDAISKRSDHLIFGYNYPKESYFNSIKNWMLKRHNFSIEREDICVAHGVIPAIALIYKSLLKEGDNIIIQPPVYGPFKNIALLNNFKVVESQLILSNNRFIIDFQDFEEKIIKNKVKVFVLCNPHNPVCRVWTKNELLQLGEICLKHKVKVISDEIHSDLVFSPNKHIPIASLSNELSNITITCTAPTKTFNLAGIKVSNILIKNPTLRKNFLDECEKLDLVSLNTFAYEICESVYTQGEPWLNELLTYLKGNYEFIKNYLSKNLPELKLVEPEATYLAWIDCTALKLSNDELKNKILNEGRLWIEYGDEFSCDLQGFIRINIATSRKNVEAALEKLIYSLKDKNIDYKGE